VLLFIVSGSLSDIIPRLSRGPSEEW
jgi:hypothetical protein